MRKTQFLNVNHLSKNCVIIAEDPDTALPNVDKNSKITKINHKNKEPNKSFYQYMKKDYQPDIFPPYTQEHRLQKPRQNQASQYIYFYPQYSASIQTQQPLQMQNPTSTQCYQSVQILNLVSTTFYQPTQMQKEITLPYYLQQQKVNLQISHKYQIRRIITIDHEPIPNGWIVNNIK